MRRPHQRVLRVVVVDRPALKSRRDGPGVKHTEVDAAWHNHLRQPQQTDALQAIRAAIVDATGHGVVGLVGGVVDHADELAGLGQFLHRRPAHAVGMKNDRLVTRLGQPLLERHHGLGGVAEHGHRDIPASRLRRRQLVAILDQALERRCDVVEDGRGDGVQTEDIDYRMHHHDVAGTHHRVEVVFA